MKIDWANIDIKQLAALVCENLEQKNIWATLVGGACVSIYTKNEYLSDDLDLVIDESIKEVIPILNELGFYKKSTRHFENPSCKFFIEFVAPPLSVGREPINKINRIKTRIGVINLLTPTDCVKDRLSAYFFWNDMQSLEQAIMVSKKNKVNFTNIKKWAKEENNEEKYKLFIKKYKA